MIHHRDIGSACAHATAFMHIMQLLFQIGTL